MAFLMSSIDVHAPGGVWQWFIVNVFGFIANYGWRIVVLVILLKLLLSPLDFYQRYKMRKNQHITEALKPQMDKLEKQYGADKQMLQRKQMELQRSSGFSYMSACLPLIITLVLFITFFTALRSVSSFMECKQYVEMYNAYVAAYNETGFDYFKRINSEFGLNDKVIIKISGVNEDGEETSSTEEHDIDFEDMDAWLGNALENEEELRTMLSSKEIAKLLDEADLSVDVAANELMRFKTEYGGSYLSYVEANKGKTIGDEGSELNLSMSVLMQIKAQDAAYDVYKNNRTSFLWIKSLWIADVPWSNAVPSWDSFGAKTYLQESHLSMSEDEKKLFNDLTGYEFEGNDGVTSFDRENANDVVTAKVRRDSSLNSNNGYLVLVILVVGLSVLSQIITTRQQKKSGQMNGQGAGMMKVMLWIMPIMLGVFAITSSSAFTLYMVTNSIMTLIINFATTMIVNVMDGSFKRKNVQVIKYGRQDPNDNIDKKNKK